jgi:siroheme synthase-like protein
MTPPPLLVALHLGGRRVVAVGSGEELDRRVAVLAAADARVTVVTTAPGLGVLELERVGSIQLARRAFAADDLDGAWLAVLCDLDEPLATRIAAECEARRILFCAVDRPGVGSYSHLAVARAGALSVAVSTSGQAPALARRLREELERLLAESGIEAFVERLAELRGATPPGERRDALGRAVEGLRIEGRIVVPK